MISILSGKHFNPETSIEVHAGKTDEPAQDIVIDLDHYRNSNIIMQPCYTHLGTNHSVKAIIAAHKSLYEAENEAKVQPVQLLYDNMSGKERMAVYAKFIKAQHGCLNV